MPFRARLTRMGLVLGLVVAATACQAAGAEPTSAEPAPWPQYRFDAGNTAHNTAESTLNKDNVAQLVEVWRVDTGGSGDPVVSDDGVFAAAGRQIRAYEMDDGESRWTIDRSNPTDPQPQLHDPGLYNGSVVVGELRPGNSGAVQGDLLSRSVADGTHVALPIDDRNRFVQGAAGAPTIVGEDFYGPFFLSFPLGGGQNYGFAGNIGGGRDLSAPSEPSPVPPPLAVDGGNVYMTHDDGSIKAFDASGVNSCSPDPNLEDMFVCEPLWTAVAGERQHSPAAANGFVYTVSPEGVLVVYEEDGDSGPDKSYSWIGQIDNGGTSPAVGDGWVYVGTQTQLAAFDESRCQTADPVCFPSWKGQLAAAASSPPTLANGVVYIATADGKLHAFDANGCGATTCDPIWTVDTPGTVTSSIVVANGRLFVSTESGNLVAYAPG